jgi:hypothetical protein
MRRVEMRDPINAEHHHLAVNHELPMPFFRAASTIHGYRSVEL